jgi:hypothetical protein
MPARQPALQANILAFQVLELLGLGYLHATVFFAPAIVALLGDPEFPAHLAARLAASELDLGLAQHVDDLLRLEVPSSHCRTPWFQ